MLFRAVTAVTAAALISYAIAAIAAESSCIPPPQAQREPADGGWKGTLRLSYNLIYQGMPPIKVSLTGDLDFIVKSEVETTEFVGPPLQRFCGRVPLGGEPIPGCEKQGNPVGAAPGANVVKVEARGRVHVLGKGDVAVKTDFQAVSAGEQLKFSMPTQKPASLSTHANVTEPRGESIISVSLLGAPSQFNFLMSASAMGGPGEWMTATGKGSGTGATSGTAAGCSKRSGGCGKGDWAHEGSRPDTEQEMLKLNLTVRDCWLMKGGVDTNKIRQSVEGSGMQVEFTEAQWEATLQDRDLKYEQDVQRFVQEPVPANLTWPYVDRVTAEFKRLTEKPSEYRLCVVHPLQTKMAQIMERALRNLVADYPKVSDGATAPVLCAANLRILNLLRQLQLAGMGDCPGLNFNEVLQPMDKEWQALWATHPHGAAATCSL
jgi:hypothetical protein